MMTRVELDRDALGSFLLELHAGARGYAALVEALTAS
jgi:hypothetical protein